MAFGYFDATKGQTPESVERTRAIVRSLLAGGRAPQNVGEGLNAIGDGIVANVLGGRADSAMQAGMASGADSWAGIASLLTPTFSDAPPAPGDGSTPVDFSQHAENPNLPSRLDFARSESGAETADASGGGLEGYIRQAAAARGIDPDTAVRVAKSEGGLKDPFRQGEAMLKYGREESYGPFQLHMRMGGVGERALAEGIDPRKDWKGGIDYALDEAAKKGWGQWFGAAKVGVGRKTGLENARALGRQAANNLADQEPVQVASLDPSIGMPEPTPDGGPIPSPRPVQTAGINVGQSPSMPVPIQSAPLPPVNSQEIDPSAAMLSPQSLTGGAPMPMQGGGVAQALLSANPAQAAPAASGVAQALVPQQVAQADMPEMAGNGGRTPQPTLQQLMEAASNPWLPPQQQGIIQSLIEQQLQQQDPLRQMQIQQGQLGIQKGQLELEQMRNPKPRDLINTGDGRLYDPNSREWIVAPNSGEGVPDAVRTLDMRAQRAGLQPGTAEYNEFMISGGKGGMSLQVGPDGTVQFQQGGSPKPLTESQSKLTLFQSLQTETQPVLLELEEQFNPANLQDAAARSTPLAGNFFQTEQGQIYNSAATAWAEGALRIATGAAATPEEMERTKNAYFAQPGDTPQTISFKAQMREMYNRSINRSLGKASPGSLPNPSDFAKKFDDEPTKGVVIDGYTIEEIDE